MRRKTVKIKAKVNVYELIKIEEGKVVDKIHYKNPEKKTVYELKELYPDYGLWNQTVEEGLYECSIEDFLEMARYVSDEAQDEENV